MNVIIDKKKRKLKKAYIFSLDVIIGMLIILVGIFLFYDFYGSIDTDFDSYKIANNIGDLLQSSKIGDICTFNESGGCMECSYKSLNGTNLVGDTTFDPLPNLCLDGVLNEHHSLLDLFAYIDEDNIYSGDEKDYIYKNIIKEVLFGEDGNENIPDRWVIPEYVGVEIMLYDNNSIVRSKIYSSSIEGDGPNYLKSSSSYSVYRPVLSYSLNKETGEIRKIGLYYYNIKVWIH